MNQPFSIRKHVRMRHFDYATPGAYFFTICLHKRTPLFGEIQDGQVVPNEIGDMIHKIWNTTSHQFPSVEIDAFIVMPDHAHGIWTLTSENFNASPISFIRVMQWFKSVTTIAYGKGVASKGWPRYTGSLWQQDYLERFLRNEFELQQKREYIAGNPGRWESNRQ